MFIHNIEVIYHQNNTGNKGTG